MMLLQVLTLARLAGPLDSAVVRDVQVAPGETLRTTSVGRGEAILLLPGVFGAAYGYRSVMGLLVEQGYRCIVVEPLGYGWSSHPKKADYSFAAQTVRVSEALDSLGVTRALVVAQSSSASIAFRLAVAQPSLVRGVLSIDGGPSEIPDEQRELLRLRLTDFAADTVPGSGQFIHEEQPDVVVDAVAELHLAAGE